MIAYVKRIARCTHTLEYWIMSGCQHINDVLWRNYDVGKVAFMGHELVAFYMSSVILRFIYFFKSNL